MRRTVATLLVVTSPLLFATPVRASDDRIALQAAGAAAAPAPVPALTPAVPTPAPAVAAPTLPTPTATSSAAPPPVRHVVRAVRPKPQAAATDLNDAAYAARLQAQLCQARQIFCGLDRSGRYPAG